ncbi:MAG: DUF4430 domain-containing protein [Oscillospiraceae bacterium]|nr:DUF4430 domain-containing protein [Oscillospiraceae bacterium]
MKPKNILLLIAMTLLMTASILMAAACAPAGNPNGNNENANDGATIPGNADTAEPVDTSVVIPTDIGEGSTSFIFEVTDDKEDITVWKVHTNETTVGAALLEAGLVEGTVSAMGLMVEFVDGLRADYMEDNAWWAFYINGEMAMEGVDTTEIEEGTLYAFVFTPA